MGIFNSLIEKWLNKRNTSGSFSVGELLKNLFNKAAIGLCLETPDGRIVMANPRFCEMLGYAKEELQAKTYEEITYPEDWPKQIALSRRLLSGEIEHFTLEKRYIRKDGTLVWGQLTVSPMHLNCLYMVAIVEDISSRMEVEEELRWAQERFSALFERSRDCVYLLDLSGRFIDANPAALELMGYKREEIPLINLLTLVPPDQMPLAKSRMEQVLREGRTAKPAEFKLFRKDGSRVFVQTEASIVLHNGYPVAIQGIGRDITERKQAEEALNESEEKFRGLAEHMNAASGIVQGKKFLYANEYMAQMLGYTVDEILSLEFTQLVHPEDRSRMIELARKRQSGEPVPGNYEFKALTKTGEMKWMDFSVGTMIYRGRPAIIGTGIDITERKRNEERLDAYTKGFQLLTDSSTRLLSTDCAGDTLHDIFDKLADHLKARVYVCYLVSTDGSRLQLHCQRGLAPAIVQLIESIDFNRTLCGIVAQQKRPIFVENVQRSAEPKAALLRLLGTRAYACHPLLGHKGLIGTLSFLADDRDRFSKDEVEFMRIASHQAAMALEHQRLADELSRRALELTKANSAKDHFMAILSHELRTPLTPVVMGISMLQDRKDLDASMRETLEMVRRNVEMEARLIDDLLDVTKIARGKIEMNRKLADLRPIIDRAVEVCMPDIEARKLNFGVEIEKSEVLFLEADSARLQQVIWNLLKNAVKFTPKGGCVGIRCFRDREQVAVEINDSGIGIEPEALPRIFNAFEQAEHSITRQFGGLGLGLAISKAIVELHGGNITAESPGRNKGATFRVRLPLVKLGKQPFSDMRKEAEPVPTRPLRILLVEDHAITAQMIKTLLNEKGHAVQVAGDMSAALELANTNRFDLILSDLGLPDGSGHELMVKLRSQGLKTPGIALSGYGQEDDIKQSYQAGFAAHLIKPASREAIMDAVASVAAGDGDSNSYSSTIH